MKITIYQKPTCTTCRKAYAILRDAGVEMESVNYYVTPLSAPKIRRLLRKMGIPAHELLRKREPVYGRLGLSGSERSEEELIDLMAKHPDLMQRPIVEKGDRAVLARPAERIRELL